MLLAIVVDRLRKSCSRCLSAIGVSFCCSTRLIRNSRFASDSRVRLAGLYRVSTTSGLAWNVDNLRLLLPGVAPLLVGLLVQAAD